MDWMWMGITGWFGLDVDSIAYVISYVSHFLVAYGVRGVRSSE